MMAFDLVIYESLDHCSKILADEFDFPFIVFYSSGLHTVQPRNPSYQPTILTTFNSVMTFSERLQNTVLSYLQIFVAHTSFQQLRVQHNLDTTKYIGDAFKSASLKFILAHFALDYTGLQHPSNVLLGGFIESPKQTMESSLAHLLDSSDQGVILFSLGSMVKAEHSHWVRFFAEAFAKLPYTVIWKLDGDESTQQFLHNNTYIYPWLPITDILSHPNTLVFINHGGRNSIHEAATYGIPSLTVPLQSEQHFQSQKLVGGVGMAIKLDIHALTETKLSDSITELITNPVYKTNAQRISKVMSIKPRAQRDEILYWVNYVVATGGARHLRPAGELGWYQVRQLDVLAVFVFITLIILIVVRYTFRIVYLLKYLCKSLCMSSANVYNSKKRN